MADYPKKFEKQGRVKTASNRRQEVQLKFEGYKQVAMDITPTSEDAPESHVDRVNALTGRDASDKASGEDYKPTGAELAAHEAEKAKPAATKTSSK